MTANKMTVNIGKWAELKIKGLPVRVKIIDAKISYGRIRYMITAQPEKPVFNNYIWVDESSLIID